MLTDSLIGIIIVVVIIIIICLYMCRVSKNCVGLGLLAGFWDGDSNFCKTAGLDKILLQISNRQGYLTPSYDCYMLALSFSEGNLIPHINHPFRLTIDNAYRVMYDFGKKTRYSASIEWIGEPPLMYDDRGVQTNWMPDKIDLTYNMSCGSLTLSNGDTIYAILYKNNQLSSTFINDVLPDNNNAKAPESNTLSDMPSNTLSPNNAGSEQI